ncbi:MAG TPA: arylsulfatase [Chitinophagaceae bacterium]|nr:arylsulfatase [Chitinophagaceae bacterium]
MKLSNANKFFFLLLLLMPLASGAQKNKKPNIILIIADDLGWGDLGYHGSEIKTPNIDQLSKEGVNLNRYYSAPICSPTRAGILTGRYPNRFGIRQTVIRPWEVFGIDSSEQCIPQLLATAGYTNRALIGKWHLGMLKPEYLPLHKGFTHFYGFYTGEIDYFTHKRSGELDWHNDEQTSYDKGYSTDLITDEAIRCIKNYNAGSPFFLYIAYNAPHEPLQAKEEDLLLYGYDKNKPSYSTASLNPKADDDESGLVPTEGLGNTKRQTYAAMVTCMDRGIGRILHLLKELKIDQNTVVIFQSDNGALEGGGGSNGSLRGFKVQEWEGGVRTPAIIKWPDSFKGGWISNQVMGYIDLLPTICDIAGVTATPKNPLDGISLLPYLQQKVNSIDRHFYLGHGSMVTNEWKLVKANAGNPKMKLSEDMLFKIAADPNETTTVKEQNEKMYTDLLHEVEKYDTIQSRVPIPPHNKGKKEFKPPKEWNIQN